MAVATKGPPTYIKFVNYHCRPLAWVTTHAPVRSVSVFKLHQVGRRRQEQLCTEAFACPSLRFVVVVSSSIKSMSLQAIEEALDVENPAMNIEATLPQDDPVIMKPRSYQLEMLEESLRRNIIVAVGPLTSRNAMYC